MLLYCSLKYPKIKEGMKTNSAHTGVLCTKCIKTKSTDVKMFASVKK